MKEVTILMSLVLILVCGIGGLLIYFRDKKKYPAGSAKSSAPRGKELIGLAGLIATVLIIILVVSWWTNPKRLRLPERIDVGSVTVASTPFAAAVPMERVTTQTIVARPDEWSEMIRVPPGHWFRWDTQTKDCYQVKNGRGVIKNSCGNEHIQLGDRLSLVDSMFSFRSLTGSEIKVIFELGPR